MNIFKHYSEKHNPNCQRLYWKINKAMILDILYNKIDIRQIDKLINICQEKNNPGGHGNNWKDSPSKIPVMVRTSGVEFFATLNTLKKVWRRRLNLADTSKLDYYSKCICTKIKDTTDNKQILYYDSLLTKLYKIHYSNNILTPELEKEIESVINTNYSRNE